MASTNSGVMMLGRISRVKMRTSDMPMVWAASMYCCRRTSWVAARASRENPGMKMMPIAVMALRMLVPSTAISTIARRMAGNENSNSMKRMRTMSTGPPKYPAAMPITPPPINPTDTATAATFTEMRAAWITRDRTSRPNSSVPNQCARLGGCSLMATSMS